MSKKDKRPAVGQQGRIETHREDTVSRTQLQIVRENFSISPRTRLMVARETGIERANICRYVAMLDEDGLIQVNRKGFCRETGHRAEYLTTDQKLFKAVQLPLFPNE